MTSRVDVSANKLDLVVQQGKAGSVAFAFTMPQGADDLAGFTFSALGFDTTPTVTVTEASGDCTLSWTDTAFTGPASGAWELACASGDTPIFAGRLIVLAPGEAGNPTAGTYTATVGEATVTATVTLAGPAGVGVPTGGTTGQTLVKASNDSYDTEWSNASAGDLVAANNLSELTATASTARTNLGLGGAAVLDVGTTTGTVAAGDDARLSDARTPTAHGDEAHTAAYLPLPSGTPAVGEVPVVTDDSPLALTWGPGGGGGGGGAMEHIATTVLGADASTIVLSSIPDTYDHLVLVTLLRVDLAGGDGFERTAMMFNASTSGYDVICSLYGTYANGSDVYYLNATKATAGSNFFATARTEIHNYKDTSRLKMGLWHSAVFSTGDAGNFRLSTGGFQWRSTAAIDTITFTAPGGSEFIAGSRVAIFGVKEG